MEIEHVQHGVGIASWAVSWRTLSALTPIRTGFQDTPVLLTVGWKREAKRIAAARALIDELAGERSGSA